MKVGPLTTESHCEVCGERTTHEQIGHNQTRRPLWDCEQCGHRKVGFLGWEWTGGQSAQTDGGDHVDRHE